MRRLERNHVLRALVLLGLTLLVYAGSCDNGFHFDDDHSIVRNPHLQSLTTIFTSFVDASTFSGDPQHGVMYRPVVVSTLVLNHAISGLDPWSYHLLNILLHGLFSLCVWALLNRWVPSSPGAAWSAAVLVAIHPIHSQIVNYVSARAGILAAIGVLGALLAVEARPKASRPWLVMAAHLAALMSKSTAIILSPLLALRMVRTEPRPNWQGPLIGVMGASAIYLILASATQFLGPSLGHLVRPLDVQVMTQLKALVYYLWLGIVPAHLSVVHSLDVAWSPNLSVILALATIGSMAGLAFHHWLRSSEPEAFGVLWFFGCLGVTFLMPLHIIVSEHRLYLSSLGAALFLVTILARRPPRFSRAWLVALAVLLGGLTVSRTADWQSELDLWQAALRSAPDVPRVHVNLGRAQVLEGDLAGARESFQRAVNLDPGYVDAWLGLAALEERFGRLATAEEYLRQAREVLPEDARIRRQLGLLRMRQGAMSEAVSLLEVAMAVQPDAVGLLHLGVAQQSMGDLSRARNSFEHALQLDPENVDAMVNLGGLIQSVGGETAAGRPEAKRLYAAALALNPDHPQALLNQAELLRIDGDLPSAIGNYQRILASDPGMVPACEGLARAQAAAGRLAHAVGSLHSCVRRSASWAEAWALLGEYQVQQGKLDAALESFTVARSLGDGRPHVTYNLAEVLVALGQQDLTRADPGAARRRWRQAVAMYRLLPTDFRRTAQRIRRLERQLQ